MARCPLYSQAKWWRFQTSAQPSPPVSLRAPALEAVVLAGRVGLRWRRLVQQPAQVDEVLLRRRALLQLRRAPLGDETGMESCRHSPGRTDFSGYPSPNPPAIVRADVFGCIHGKNHFG